MTSLRVHSRRWLSLKSYFAGFAADPRILLNSQRATSTVLSGPRQGSYSRKSSSPLGRLERAGLSRLGQDAMRGNLVVPSSTKAMYTGPDPGFRYAFFIFSSLPSLSCSIAFSIPLYVVFQFFS